MVKLRNALLAFSSLALVAWPAAANEQLIRNMIGTGAAIFLQQQQQQQQQMQQGQAQRPGTGYRPSGRQSQAEIDRMARLDTQMRLNALGFNAGNPDGVYGPQTRQAIARFQASIGRNPDGKLSREEVEVLKQRTAGMVPDQGFAGYGGPGQQPMPPGAFPGAPAAPGSFPTLAAPGQAPAAGGAFPTLGAPGAAPAPAFPGMGTPPAPGQTAGAFPSLGAPAPAQQNQGSFPTLGAPAAQPGGAGAFPAIGAAPDAPAAPAFPGMAPAPGQPDQSFPGMAAAPEQGSTGMPALGQPGTSAPAPATGLVASSLEAEVAKTKFATLDAQPSVAGIALGHKAEDIRKKLAEQGYGNCNEDGSQPIVCQRDSDTLSDWIGFWHRNDGTSWAMGRAISFKEPAPADLVTEQFRASYPELMDAPGRMLTSGQFCAAGQIAHHELEVILSSLATMMDNPQIAMHQGMVDFAVQCPLVYKIELHGTDAVHTALITFFETTGVVRAAIEREENAKASEAEKRKKIAGDLKL